MNKEDQYLVILYQRDESNDWIPARIVSKPDDHRTTTLAMYQNAANRIGGDYFSSLAINLHRPETTPLYVDQPGIYKDGKIFFPEGLECIEHEDLKWSFQKLSKTIENAHLSNYLMELLGNESIL